MSELHELSRTEAAEAPRATLDSALAAHAFVCDLPEAYLRLIARCGEMRNVAAGQYLWRQGERNVEAYLVIEGEVALEIAVPHEGKVSFESVQAGDVAGCTALFHTGRWGFDARAVGPVRAVVLDSRRLRAAIENDHEFGYRLLEKCTQSLGKRLIASRFKLVEAHDAALA
jgi:CRP-like cAMP-binding protein